MSYDQETYTERINRMQRHVPLLQILIKTLENTPKTGDRDICFHKMETLLEILTSSKKRTNPEGLMRAEEKLCKLQKVYSLSMSRMASIHDKIKPQEPKNCETENLIKKIKAEISSPGRKSDCHEVQKTSTTKSEDTKNDLPDKHSVKNLDSNKMPTNDKEKAVVDARLEGIKKELAHQLKQVKSSSKLLAKELGISFKGKDRRNENHIAAKSKSVEKTSININEFSKTTENIKCTHSIKKTALDEHKTSKPSNSDSRTSFSEVSKEKLKSKVENGQQDLGKSSKDGCSLKRKHSNSRHKHHKKDIKDKSELPRNEHHQSKSIKSSKEQSVNSSDAKTINSNSSSCEHKFVPNTERKPTNLNLSSNDTSANSSKMCQSVTKPCESSFKTQNEGKDQNFSGVNRKHKRSRRHKRRKHRSKEANRENLVNSKNHNTDRKDYIKHESQNTLQSNIKVPKMYLKNITSCSSNSSSKQSEAYVSFEKSSKPFTVNGGKCEDQQESKSVTCAKSHDIQNCSLRTDNNSQLSRNLKTDAKSIEEGIRLEVATIEKSKSTTASTEEKSVLTDNSEAIEVNNNTLLNGSYANHEKKNHEFMQTLKTANVDDKNKTLNVSDQPRHITCISKDQIPKVSLERIEIMYRNSHSESQQSLNKRPIEKPAEENGKCHGNKKKKGYCSLVREMVTIQRDKEEMFKFDKFGDPTGRRICSIESEIKTRAHLEIINKTSEEDKCGALKRRKSLSADSKRVKLDTETPLTISEQVSYQRSSDKPEGSFNQLNALKNSFQTVQKGNKFSGKCLFCNELIETSEIEWFEHIFGHNNQYLYLCSFCKNKGLAKCDSKLTPECETNKNIKSLLTQQINSDKVKIFICGFCNYVAYRTEYMIVHLTKYHQVVMESSHLEMFHKVFTIVFLKTDKSNCSNKETIVISDSEDDDVCIIQENNNSGVDQIRNQNNFMPNYVITISDANGVVEQNVLIQPRIISGDMETRKHVMHTPRVKTVPVRDRNISDNSKKQIGCTEKSSNMIAKRSATNVQTRNGTAHGAELQCGASPKLDSHVGGKKQDTNKPPPFPSTLSSVNNAAGVQATSESSEKHNHILSLPPEKQDSIQSSDITNQNPYNIQIYFQEQIDMIQPSNATDMVLVLTNDTKDPNVIETYIIEDVKVDHNEKSTNVFQEDSFTGVTAIEDDIITSQKESEGSRIPKYVPPDRLYVCPQKECNVENESLEYLEMHLKAKHYETKEFICGFCNTKTSAVLDHLQYHSKIIYKCSLCDFIHYKYFDLAIHMQQKHKGKVDKITILSRGSLDETKFLEFVQLKNEEIWRCNMCSLANQTHRNITNHIDTTHQKTVFSCKFCKHSTDQEQSLIQHHKAFHSQHQLGIFPDYPAPIVDLFHKTIETAIKKFLEDTNPTRVCSTIDGPDDNIAAPEPCSTQNITFTCKYCFECFDDVSSIEQHWMYSHDTSFPFEFGISKKYKCSYCNLETSLEYLKEHHMTSHQQHSFKIGNNTIQDMSDLWLSAADDIKDDLIEEMMKGNNNLKLIECLKCNALFREIEYAYSHHEQFHRGLLEIKLGKHSEKHLLWGCSLCQMFYETEKHLIRHFWNHLKVYICRFCLLNFEDHDQLVNHYKTIHQENVVTYLTLSDDGGYNIQSYQLNCVVLFKNGLLLRKEELINTNLGKFDNFNNTLREIIADELNYWKRVQDANQGN